MPDGRRLPDRGLVAETLRVVAFCILLAIMLLSPLIVIFALAGLDRDGGGM